MARIVIFGATGMTGLCTMEYALQKGLSVRAFVRDESKVPEHLKDKVEISKGNALDYESVEKAVEGMDAVIICLGTHNDWGHTTDMSEGTKNIVKAMVAKNVKVVSAVLSAFLFYERSMLPEDYNPITDEHRRMYEALRDSPLDFIAVNVAIITDEPRREYILTVNPKFSPGKFISKLDVAAFLVDSLKEPKYYRTQIGMAYEKNLTNQRDFPEIEHLFSTAK